MAAYYMTGSVWMENAINQLVVRNISRSLGVISHKVSMDERSIWVNLLWCCWCRTPVISLVVTVVVVVVALVVFVVSVPIWK
jgi:hypothetical protein